MTCHNNCISIHELILVKVSDTYFIDKFRNSLQNRKGTKNVESKQNNGNIIFNITVNSSEYKKYNYFKYRNYLNNENTFEIKDIKDGLVELTFTGVPLFEASKCLECGELFHSELNITNDDIYDTVENDDWFVVL